MDGQPPAKRRFSVDVSQAVTSASYFPVHVTHDASANSNSNHNLGHAFASFASDDSMTLLKEESEASENGSSADPDSADHVHYANSFRRPSEATPDSTTAGTPTDGTTPTKKRARATTEQLAILEDVFLTQTSPNAKLREILAARVNMTERSIQIWFQNRRAKVKLMQKRAAQHAAQEQAARAHSYMAATYGMQGGGGGGGGATGFFNPYGQQSVPFSPYGHPALQNRPQLGRSTSVDFSAMGGQQVMPLMPVYNNPNNSNANSNQMHQPLSNAFMSALHKTSTPPLDGGIQLPSEALSIGSWQRVPIAADDLIITVDATNQLIRYQITEGSSRFKIEASFSSLLAVSFDPVDAFQAHLILDVATPPVFFMAADGAWTQCRDFTEDKQATCVLRHVVRGDAGMLSQEWGRACRINPMLQRVTRILSNGGPVVQPHQAVLNTIGTTHAMTQSPASASSPSLLMDGSILQRPSSPFRRHSTPALLVSQFPTFEDSYPSASASSAVPFSGYAESYDDTTLSLSSPESLCYPPPYQPQQSSSTDALLADLSYISLEPQQQHLPHQQQLQQQPQIMAQGQGQGKEMFDGLHVQHPHSNHMSPFDADMYHTLPRDTESDIFQHLDLEVDGSLLVSS
ncbi:hypothetical protein HKX48_001875 [Thoreauomyces humboldtii]|nr:hypothetical protein HKX48_001875 [Thoreauomyces humboldtii]